MAKTALKTASVLAFERNLDVSDAFFWQMDSQNTDKQNDNEKTKDEQSKSEQDESEASSKHSTLELESN